MCTANGLDLSAWRPKEFAKLTLRAGARGAKGLAAPTPDNLKDVTRGAMQDTGDLIAGRRSVKKIEAGYDGLGPKTPAGSSGLNPSRQSSGSALTSNQKRRRTILAQSAQKPSSRTVLGG